MLATLILYATVQIAVVLSDIHPVPRIKAGKVKITYLVTR